MSQAGAPPQSKYKKYYEKNKEAIKVKNAEINRRRRSEKSSQSVQIGTGIESQSQELREYITTGVQTDPVDDSLEKIMEEYWQSPAYPDFEDLFSVMKTKVVRPSRNFTAPLSALEEIEPQFPQYESFIKLRAKVQKWSSPWGGISSWPDTFEILLDRSIDRGPERISQFIERLWVHELAGKQLLRSLQAIEGYLPNNHPAVKILWAYQQEQLIEVVQGLTIIQTRLPIIRRSLYSIGSSTANFHSIIQRSFDAEPVIADMDQELEEEELIQQALVES